VAVIKRFEDIIAWQKAEVLTLEIYQTFKTNRDFSFRDQVQRASVSIMNNIAEGFERHSDAELRQFLYISKGSCGEVRSMLTIALKLQYINEKQFKSMYDNAVEISKTLSGLIKSLKS